MSKILGFVAFALSFSNWAHAEPVEIPLPRAMAVLGDSMSEGMLAGYSLEKRPSISVALNILWMASDSDQNQRMLSYRKNLARPDLSWASGNSTRSIVKSHAQRLKEFQPNLVAANFAISGDESYRLNDQIDRLMKAERDQGMNFDYVTLMIGANDLAGESNDDITPPLAYLGNVESALRRLIEEDSHRSFLLVGLPDIHHVFEQSQDFSVIEFWGEKVTCKSMRKDIYGRKTVFFPENQEAYQFTKATLQQYRDGLANLVERLKAEFSETNFKYIREYRLPTNIKKAISIDCFHPSEWGQAELAEMTWAEGFWPNLQSSDFAVWSQSR